MTLGGLALVALGITIVVVMIVKRTGLFYILPLSAVVVGLIMIARGSRFFYQARHYL